VFELKQFAVHYSQLTALLRSDDIQLYTTEQSEALTQKGVVSLMCLLCRLKRLEVLLKIVKETIGNLEPGKEVEGETN
jgi:hypothetical protein